MPRKIRQLRADLRRARFAELRDRGKGSHRRYLHPLVPEFPVTLAGNDGDDAQPYQEAQVRAAIAEARRAEAAEERRRRHQERSES